MPLGHLGGIGRSFIFDQFDRRGKKCGSDLLAFGFSCICPREDAEDCVGQKNILISLSLCKGKCDGDVGYRDNDLRLVMVLTAR